MDLPFPAMMNLQPDTFLFAVPLTEANHEVAQRFYTHHSDPRRAKQVYLNTLSVQAVHFYLTCMGFSPDLDQGISWNPDLQALMDTADLWVDSFGRLECCPVLPDMDAMPISPQAIADRIGYVAVRLNESLSAAELLGFVSALNIQDDAEQEAPSVPLKALQALDELPDYLASLAADTQAMEAKALADKTLEVQESDVQNSAMRASGAIAKSTMPEKAIAPPITHLSQWLNDQVDGGWQRLETLMEQLQDYGSSDALGYSFRQPLSPPTTELSPLKEARLGKLLTVGDQPNDMLLFMVGVSPVPSSRDLTSDLTSDLKIDEMNITVEVYPFEPQAYLPQALQLVVMDEKGKPVLQAEGSNSEGLEFQFSGERGERFSVKVALEDRHVIEDFQI